MAQTKTYDPGEVRVIVGGNIIGGFADGTMITIERSENAFSLVIGADGQGCRVRSRNKSGKITLTLMQSSLSNNVLSTIAQADELTGEGVVPLLIEDGNGTTIVAVENCWIEKMASAEFSKDLGNREWPLACEQIDMFVGGNS